MKRETLLKTIEDLMESHDQLMAGIAHIVVDYALLNESRIAGSAAIHALQQAGADEDVELEELRERDILLSALEAGGVDNWEGYDFSREDAGLI